jgi:hypothetical protein
MGWTISDWRDISVVIASAFNVLAVLPGLFLVLKNVRKIEIATNSMKDALVQATASTSHAEGMLQGRLDAETRADLLDAKEKA